MGDGTKALKMKNNTFKSRIDYYDEYIMMTIIDLLCIHSHPNDLIFIIKE